MNKEERAIYNKQYYQQNRDKLRELHKKYKQDHHDEQLEYQRKYNKENYDYIKQKMAEKKYCNICDKNVTYITRHQRSKKHLKLLELCNEEN